jgi:hypothetical protein
LDIDIIRVNGGWWMVKVNFESLLARVKGKE